MPTRDTIVVGASAGGVQVLSTLIAGLPADLPAAVFIVLHIPTNAPSLLPSILSRNANILVTHAEDGEEIPSNEPENIPTLTEATPPTEPDFGPPPVLPIRIAS